MALDGGQQPADQSTSAVRRRCLDTDPENKDRSDAVEANVNIARYIIQKMYSSIFTIINTE